MVEGMYAGVGSFKLSEMDTEEMTVVIYFSEDAVRAQDTSTETQDTKTQTETRTQPSTVVKTRSRCSRLAVVCVGLLCVFLLTTNIVLYMNSREDCRERGADLVIINSRVEQMFLTDQKKDRNFWIGLTDENMWKWVDGQPLTDKFWKKHEPNDAHGGEDCAVFTTTAEFGWRTWNDISCSVRENWVCEFNTAKCHRMSNSTKIVQLY
ncbi:hypothetical protein SRHO_G00253920 [Serrasalmus rhombeus]